MVQCVSSGQRCKYCTDIVLDGIELDIEKHSTPAISNLTPKTARIVALEVRVAELQRTVAALNNQTAQLRTDSLGYLRSMNEYSAVNVNMRTVEINRIENELNNQLNAPYLQTYPHIQTLHTNQQQQLQQNQQEQQQRVQPQHHHKIPGHICNQNVAPIHVDLNSNSTAVTGGVANRASFFKLTNSAPLDPPQSFMPSSSTSPSIFCSSVPSASLSRAASASTGMGALSLMSNSQHQFFANESGFGGSKSDNRADNVPGNHDGDNDAMQTENEQRHADDNFIDDADTYSNISAEDRENDIQLNLRYPYDERFARGSNAAEKFNDGKNLSELHDPNSEKFFKILNEDKTAVTVEQISAFNNGCNPFRRGGRYLRRRHCENLDNYRTACTLTLSRRKVRKEFVVHSETPSEFYEQDNWWLVATSNNMPFPIVLEHPIGPRFCRIGDVVRTTGLIDGTDDIFVHFWSFQLEFISEVGRGGMPKFGNVLFGPAVGSRIYWIGKEGSKNSFDLCTAVRGFVADGIELQRLLDAERGVGPAIVTETKLVETGDKTVTNEKAGVEIDENDENNSGDEIDGENLEPVASDDDETSIDENENYEQGAGIESKPGVQNAPLLTGLSENNNSATVEFQERRSPIPTTSAKIFDSDSPLTEINNSFVSETPDKSRDIRPSFSTPNTTQNVSLFLSASFGSTTSSISLVEHRLIVSDNEDECNDTKDTPPAKAASRLLQRKNTAHTGDGLNSQQTLVNISQQSMNNTAGESKKIDDNSRVDDSFDCSSDSSLSGSSVDMSKITGELSPIFASVASGTNILSAASPRQFASSPLNPLASRGNGNFNGSPALKRKTEDQHGKVKRNESFLSDLFGKNDEIDQEN
ncbi:hypothetical protein HK100_007125 [Physocladia obscura]|uniref:Uncharacterized protein n=1 Tax=Physocladia obscura TaxID=109957 RepID=A0AAD5T7C1_9FUNG|nr:hypothetical protein HK100_007125 [Physocladia obscura]